MSWEETIKTQKQILNIEVHNLRANETYQLFINNKPIKKYTATPAGVLYFDYPLNTNVLKIQLVPAQ